MERNARLWEPYCYYNFFRFFFFFVGRCEFSALYPMTVCIYCTHTRINKANIIATRGENTKRFTFFFLSSSRNVINTAISRYTVATFSRPFENIAKSV